MTEAVILALITSMDKLISAAAIIIGLWMILRMKPKKMIYKSKDTEIQVCYNNEVDE